MKIRRNVNVTKVVLTNFILSPVQQHKNKHNCQSYGTMNPNNNNNNNNTDLECTLNTKEKCEDKHGCSENRAKQCHIRNRKKLVRRHVS